MCDVKCTDDGAKLMIVDSALIPTDQQSADLAGQGFRWDRRRRRRRRRRRSWSRRRGRRSASRRRGKAGEKKRCCSCSPDRSPSGSRREGRAGTAGRKGRKSGAEWQRFEGESGSGNGRSSRRETRTNGRKSASYNDHFEESDDANGATGRYAMNGNSRKGGKGGKGKKNGKWGTEKSVTFTSDDEYYSDDEPPRSGNGANGTGRGNEGGMRGTRRGNDGGASGRSSKRDRYLESGFDASDDVSCPRHGADRKLLLIERTFFDNVVIVKRTQRNLDGSTKIVIVTRRIRPGEERRADDHVTKTTSVTKYSGDKLVKEVTKSIPGRSSQKAGQKTTTVTTADRNGSVTVANKTSADHEDVDEDDDDDESDEDYDSELEGDTDATDEEDDEDEDDEDEDDEDDDDGTGSGVQFSAKLNKDNTANFSISSVSPTGAAMPWRQTYVCVPGFNNQVTCRPNIIPVAPGGYQPSTHRGIQYNHQITQRQQQQQQQPQGCPSYALYPHLI